MNEPARRAHGRRLTALVLAVVTVALVVVGAVFLVKADSLRTSGALANKAVIDNAATTQVIGQVSTALNQVLSYDYAKPSVAQAAAARWLAGDAPAQYKVLFSELQKLAPDQKLVLVAKVSVAGVTSLKGTTAQLLVFVDQRSTSTTSSQSSISAAQVQITAKRTGARWKITELKPI